MKIKIGSKNQVKIKAATDAVKLYPNIFPNPEMESVHVEVDQFGHPKTLKDTLAGAIQRAKESFKDCAFSFGIEGGMMEVPFTKTGYMEVGACAIYDGKNIYLGLSPAFEWPKKVTDMILTSEADASQAFRQLGYTSSKKLGGEAGGIIGFLTDQRLTREEQTKHSIIMALIQLERPNLYK